MLGVVTRRKPVTEEDLEQFEVRGSVGGSIEELMAYFAAMFKPVTKEDLEQFEVGAERQVVLRTYRSNMKRLPYPLYTQLGAPPVPSYYAVQVPWLGGGAARCAARVHPTPGQHDACV